MVLELSSGDDFLVPVGVDLTEECDSNSDILGNNIVLPLGGCLSILCYIYIMWMYYVVKSPVLMRHPTTLAIYKCILDLFFVQQFLWLPFVRTSLFYTNDDDDGNVETFYCRSSWVAGLLAFSTQFFLLGSELCFLIISVDLRMAYTNPFTSFEANKWYFGAFIFLASAITGLGLIAMGPRVYGLASEGVVWVQDRRSNQSPNYPKMILLYCIIFLVYLYCIWANFQYGRSVERGLGKTVSNRISIMERSKRYTLAYIAYNTVTLTLEFLSFLDVDNSSVLNSLPAYFYSCRGIGALLIILYSNKNDITWENMNPFNISQRSSDEAQNLALEGLLLQPHLNIALRVEILYFTTLGIMHAARDVDDETNHASKRATDIIGDESRCYSFDDHHSGVRPSVLEDGMAAVRAGKRPSSTGAELTPQPSHSAAAPQPPSTRNTLAELEKLEELQNKAVTMVVEAALLDQVESRRFHNPAISVMTEQTRLSLNARGSTEMLSGHAASALSSSASISQPRRSTGQFNPLIIQSVSHPRDTAASDRMDTADVEFSMMRNTETDAVNKVANGPHWQRVDEPKRSDEGQSHYSNSRSETLPFASKASATDMLRSMLNNAIANATIAAKNVFSPASKDFRFKDFCPKLFAAVRAMHNISASEYAKSFETTCRERFSEGRSGAFMFYSSDQRCIVKTTTMEESATLNSIMPVYVKHLEENPNSLLVRFLGSHCITMYGVEIYFVVMLNFFPNSPLSERYDLKGSWVNRHGMNGKPRTHTERMKSQQLQLAPLYQDNDLQHKISLDSPVAKAMADQIQKDILFLRNLNRMDYSLLIGVKRERFEVLHGRGAGDSRAGSLDQGQPFASLASLTPRNWHLNALEGQKDPFQRQEDGGVRAKVVEGPGTYYFGIIDILQAWNWRKRLERFVKVNLKFEDGNGLSAINSKTYADRFYRRCVIDAFEGLDEQAVTNAWHAASCDANTVKACVDTATVTASTMITNSDPSSTPSLRQVRPIEIV